MCYIFTHDTCCTCIHDYQIQASLDNLISASCEENFYDLIQYFCFGCYNVESTYINRQLKTIFLCSDFAARIWTGGNNDPSLLNVTQNTYDNCGLQVAGQIRI